ncbi:MAG: twin-arginine translocase TatA/TatE family subunit [Actinomycetota bacterium]|nr:twin-arginine translocase TatA/TatE family subunit [Actinomycetota bacterium]
MPTSLGPAEILVILVVALIVLGPKRLPEAGRQVGRAIAEVRKWSQGFQDEIRSAVDFDPGPPSYPTPPAGTRPSPIPMVPAETSPPADASGNGSAPPDGGSVTTGSHGHVSGPAPAADVPPPDPPEPPAGEPPRS